MRYLLTLLFTLSIALSSCTGAQPDRQPISQRRINEFAAMCEATEVTFTGFHDKVRPVETPTQYKTRIGAYIRALNGACSATAPLRTAKPSRDVRAANMAVWQRINLTAAQLPARVQTLTKTWATHQAPSEAAPMASHLEGTLQMVQRLLLDLRNARP